MTKRWVAIDVAVGDNPKVWRFAAELYQLPPKYADLGLPAAVGHVSMLLGAVKLNAPDGDISAVPDDLLELWAKWRGKRGAFAPLYRRRFAPDGKIKDWEEWNGRLLAKQEAERQRWHRRRGGGDSGGDSIGNSGGDSAGDSAESPPHTLPYPTNSSSHAISGAGSMDSNGVHGDPVLSLIVALNQGMRDNPDIGGGADLADPVPHGHGPSRRAAADILEQVDPEFARGAVYEIAKNYRPKRRGDRISTLGYCTQAVLGRWEKREAGEAAAATSRPRSPQRKPTRSTPSAAALKLLAASQE